MEDGGTKESIESLMIRYEIGASLFLWQSFCVFCSVCLERINTLSTVSTYGT
jgi:hypothetical protein